MLIDESHNLRDREGNRYRAIQEYIRENDSKYILLSATPCNKTYLGLSSQLRLFVPEDKEPGIRLGRPLREIGETEFMGRDQAPIRSIVAFEKSSHTDGWRELMRLYLVRRTRGFVQDNGAATDSASGRQYLTFEDGTRSYFPTRVPKTPRFDIDDQYARLFADDVVDTITCSILSLYDVQLTTSIGPPPPPLRQVAVDTLNRQLRSGISDQALTELVVALRDEDRLCIVHGEDERRVSSVQWA